MYDVLEMKWKTVPKFKSMCLRTLDCMFFEAMRTVSGDVGLTLKILMRKGS